MFHRARMILYFACSLALALIVSGQKVAARTYGPHSGYLESIEGERQLVVEDLVIVSPPEQGPSLRERIFNEQLTKEFTDRYEEKFGRTEQQRAYLAPNNNTYYNDLFGFQGTPEETNDERRRFGDFMIKRLAEFHLENYAKNDPKVRPVWEAKERLSNVKLAVGKKFEVKAKYSISGNAADIDLRNPWVQTKVRMQIGGSFAKETIFSLSRGITNTVSAETHYAFRDGIISLIGRKAITSTLGTSLTASTYTHNGGTSRRESLYLAGVSYVY